MPNFESSNVNALSINNLTVREFANLLASLPENMQVLPITHSGYKQFYLHYRAKEKCLTLDEEEFID